MRKILLLKKLMLGGEKINKSVLARHYNCCWRTRLYNLIKKDIDYQGEIVNSKELKKLEIITEIKEYLENIIYNIIEYKNS